MSTRKIETIEAILIIDMQKGFLRGQESLVDRVVSLSQKFPAERLWWLKYRNEPDSLFAQHLDWQDVMVAPQTNFIEPLQPQPGHIFEHYSYSLPENLIGNLKQYKEVGLVGVDTDACIFAAAFNLWDEGIRPLILANYCASSGGDTFHRAALDMMRRQFGIASILHEMI